MATPDLLSGLTEEKGPDTSSLDLLSQIAEDDGQAWMPWSDNDQPKALQGKVKTIGSVSTDATYGAVRDVPLIGFEASDGTVWSVRGYGMVVEGQLAACVAGGMKVGDHFAVKYLGDKQGKSAKPYHNVKAAFAAA